MNDMTNDTHSNKAFKCTRKMFGNDTAAFMACQAEYALQQNWYPDPIGGLFSYQTWNGFDGFWQNGVVLEALTNFMAYANNTRYKTVVLSSYRELEDLKWAYSPIPSYDDMMWYALSYLRIYEVLGNQKDKDFLQLSTSILDWVYKTGWDQKEKPSNHSAPPPNCYSWNGQNWYGEKECSHVVATQCGCPDCDICYDGPIGKCFEHGVQLWNGTACKPELNTTCGCAKCVICMHLRNNDYTNKNKRQKYNC